LKKHFSSQRFPNSYYIPGNDKYPRKLMGSLDALDIVNGRFKVRSIWNQELQRFAKRSLSSIDFFISKNK
jgi:hypothetical protein